MKGGKKEDFKYSEIWLGWPLVCLESCAVLLETPLKKLLRRREREREREREKLEKKKKKKKEGGVARNTVT